MENFLSDSHTDFMTAIKTKHEREKYISKCAQHNVRLISSAIFTTESKFNVDDIKNFNDEIIDLSKKYNINLLLSIEDLGFIQNCQDLNKLIKIKPFSSTLTWNEENQYGGGAHTRLGLTNYGKEVISLFEENNILIDTAHMSRQTFNDFIKVTKFPIFNSHSNIDALFSHQRNLTDEQIQKIVDSNGYLGLTMYEKFVSNSKITSYDIAKQFDYLITRFGSDNFGIGSDLYGISLEYLPTDIKKYGDLIKISDYLTLMGHNKETIEKIMYKNFLNFTIKQTIKK